MRSLLALTSATMTLIGFGVLAQQPAPPLQLSKAAYEAVLAAPEDDTAFNDFLRRLPTITLGTQPRRTFYVLEGDLLLTREEVRASITYQAKGPRPAVSSGELLVLTAAGKPVLWDKEHRNLTYAVNRASFPSQQVFDQVVANMEQAANEWVNACLPCALSFTHKSEFDQNPNNDHVTFVVTYDPNETSFIAASFFPNDPPYKRYLIVAPEYQTTTFDKVGVFRHEIGHILGYRHEHIQGISGCYSEDKNWKPLTPYDPHSVMHYFCGGAGSIKLELTDSDKTGHSQLYR